MKKNGHIREVTSLTSFVSLLPLEQRVLFTAVNPELATGDLKLALIDESLPQQEVLSDGFAGFQQIRYNSKTSSASDVLHKAIAATISQNRRISALAIVSHGSDGAFGLGDELITEKTIGQTSDQWKDLAGHFARDAEIAIYGCDVAHGSAGQALIETMHSLTGASVFGSNDITGEGGDWVLEAASTGARTDAHFGNDRILNAYQGTLLLPVVTQAAAANPNPATGTTINLSALGHDLIGSDSNLIYTWTATIKPAGAAVSFSANGTNAAKNTIATVDKAGAYTFTAAISNGLTAYTSVNVTVQSAAGSGQITPATLTLPLNGSQTLSLSALDQFGLPILSLPGISWSVTSGAGSINSSGVYTAPSSPTTATIQASVLGITASININVVNTAPTVSTPSAIDLNLDTGLTGALSVLGADDGGLLGLTYTWDAIEKPVGAAVSFSRNGTNAAKTATITFDKAGQYKLRATITDPLGLSTTSDVTITVAQIATTVEVSPATASSSLNASRSFSATAYDQFGNAMASQPTFDWSATTGSINSSGTYTAPATPGLSTVTALIHGGLVSGTSLVTVTNAAPTVATPAAGSPSSIASSTTTLSVLGADDGGESALSYTWTVISKPASAANPVFNTNGSNSAKSVIATFSAAGSYTFRATITDAYGSTVTSDASITVNQTMTSISVVPATTSVSVSGTQQFDATALDQFGNALSSQPAFSWSADHGSINSSGFYTAPSSDGTATITAQAGGLTGTAAVTISDSAPSVATPAQATPNPATGTTTALSVLGSDDGGEGSLQYTWVTISKPTGSTVLYSINGTNAAKDSIATFDTAGSYTLRVTISDGVATTTSTVNITVQQTLTSIVVSGSLADLPWNGTRAFSATAYDQFGDVLISQPTFNWQVSNGTISPLGIVTAPLDDDTLTVTASFGGVSGTLNLDVVNSAPTIDTNAWASEDPVEGTSVTLNVLGDDDGLDNQLTYSWTVLDKPNGSSVDFNRNSDNASKTVVATFDRAGDYSFEVTISDSQGLTVTSTVDVTVAQVFDDIDIQPTVATVIHGTTTQFSATALDQFGQEMPFGLPVEWDASTGTIDDDGNFTPPAALEDVTITASSGGIETSIEIEVTNAAPTIHTAAAGPDEDVAGITALLTTLGADDAGETGLIYTWSVVSSPDGVADPIFSINGSNSAKDTIVSFAAAGIYDFKVTISDGLASVASFVQITVVQSISTIEILPDGVTSNVNSSIQFIANQLDQFGQAMTLASNLDWETSAGSMSNEGILTLPSNPGDVTLQARVGDIVGSTVVYVKGVLNQPTATVTNVGAKQARLTASVDGIAPGTSLLYSWSLVSKPSGAGTPAIDDAQDPSTIIRVSKAGTYKFQVTATDGFTSSNRTVTVNIKQSATTLAIDSTSSRGILGTSRNLSAKVLDQFGDILKKVKTTQWSLDYGSPGYISSTGRLTIPFRNGGTIVVRAWNGALSATKKISITDKKGKAIREARVSATKLGEKQIALQLGRKYLSKMNEATHFYVAEFIDGSWKRLGKSLTRISELSVISNLKLKTPHKFALVILKGKTRVDTSPSFIVTL